MGNRDVGVSMAWRKHILNQRSKSRRKWEDGLTIEGRRTARTPKLGKHKTRRESGLAGKEGLLEGGFRGWVRGAQIQARESRWDFAGQGFQGHLHDPQAIPQPGCCIFKKNYLFLFILNGKWGERERNTSAAICSGSFLKYPQQVGLGQTEVRG